MCSRVWRCVKDFGSDFSKPITKESTTYYTTGSHYESEIDSEGKITTKSVNDYDSFTSGGAVKTYELGGFSKTFLFLTYLIWAIPRYIYLSHVLYKLTKECFSEELIQALQSTSRVKLDVFKSSHKTIKKEKSQRERQSAKYSYLPENQQESFLPIFIRKIYKNETYYALHVVNHHDELPNHYPLKHNSFYAIKLNDKNSYSVSFFNVDRERIYSDNSEDWRNELKYFVAPRQLAEAISRIENEGNYLTSPKPAIIL